MSPGDKVTRFGATDLGSEVPGHAQQKILGGVDVAGARIHGAELGATDLDVELGAMYSGAEHAFKACAST